VEVFAMNSLWARLLLRHPWRGLLACAAVICAAAVTQTASATSTTPAAHHRAAGAGRTIIEGGTGGTSPLPVTTTVAFHATGNGGDFECLALAPSTLTGAGSGTFTTNAMYVTGPVSSLAVNGDTAVLRGVATVTGLGAGQNRAFTVTITDGGPGATVVLTVSGLTFHEILIEGHFSVS
jgi:hypothetical protein